MHIIKVGYVLMNVYFHLLVVLVNIRRFLVVWRTGEIFKDLLRSSSGAGHRISVGARSLGKHRQMEGRACFSAFVVPEQAGCSGNMIRLPLFAVKRHRETAHIVVFQYQGGKWVKESLRSGTRIISPLPQLVPMMWKSSVWRNQTERKITEAPVVAAKGVDTGVSQQY